MEKWIEDNFQKLRDAANVELTDKEQRVLTWLAGWEDSTVQTMCDIIRKVADSRLSR